MERNLDYRRYQTKMRLPSSEKNFDICSAGPIRESVVDWDALIGMDAWRARKFWDYLPNFLNF